MEGRGVTVFLVYLLEYKCYLRCIFPWYSNLRYIVHSVTLPQVVEDCQYMTPCEADSVESEDILGGRFSGRGQINHRWGKRSHGYYHHRSSSWRGPLVAHRTPARRHLLHPVVFIRRPESPPFHRLRRTASIFAPFPLSSSAAGKASAPRLQSRLCHFRRRFVLGRGATAPDLDIRKLQVRTIANLINRLRFEYF